MTRQEAFGINRRTQKGGTSVGASLFLLVKYAVVTPDQFLCLDTKHPAESFSMSAYPEISKGLEQIDLWDFGPYPIRHYDYAYHAPFGDYALAVSNKPTMAVAADLNPWISDRRGSTQDFSAFLPDTLPWQGTIEQARSGNSVAHKGDGQNVLFLDSHVGFETRPYAATDSDSIYTVQDEEDRFRGTAPVLFEGRPANATDSLLLHDPPASEK